MKQRHPIISGNIEMLDKVHFKDYSPSALIFLSPSCVKIFAEEKRWSQVEFVKEETGELVMSSLPPSPKEYGIFAWLKFIHFYSADQLIAEIRYRSWTGEPCFIVNKKEMSVAVQRTKAKFIYVFNDFEIIQSCKSASTIFNIYDTSYLYQCIGFAYYIWALQWSCT